MSVYLVTTVDGDVRRYDVAELSFERGGVLVLALTDTDVVRLSPTFWQEIRGERGPVVGR